MMKIGEKQIGIHGYAWPRGRLSKTKSSDISAKKTAHPVAKTVTLQSDHTFSQVFETAARWLANAKVSQIHLE